MRAPASVHRFVSASTIVLALLSAGSGAAHAAPPLEAYGQLPGVEFLALSPSGERYAVVGMADQRRTFAAVRVDGGVELAAGVEDTKVSGVRWADDEHVMMFYRGTFSARVVFEQDYELGMATVLDLRRKKPFTAFGNSNGAARTVLGYFGSRHVDGRLYGYFGGLAYARNGAGEFGFHDGYRDLFRIDLDTGKVQLVDDVQKKIADWVIAENGDVAAHSDYLQGSGRWTLYRGRDSRQQLYEQVDPMGDVMLMGPGRSAGTVLVFDASGEQDTLYEVSQQDGARQQLFADVTLEETIGDPDSDHLIGALIQEEPRARFFDPRLQARYEGARKAFPGYEVQLVSLSRNLDRLIVKTDGKDDSGTYWLVDIASRNAQPIGYAYPRIGEKDVGPTQWFDYKAADGTPIQAVLTLPPGRDAKGLPLVVMPHGGPIGPMDRIGFDWWAQAFASAGYAVLQPNYRGSGGYGEAFRDAGYRQWGRKMQSDLSDGVAALAASGVIDSRRACIVGASYGGYAALAGVTLQQGIYRCSVAVAGVADLARFFMWQVERNGRKSDNTRFWKAVTGADVEGVPAMSPLSPTHSAAQADAPILLIHGKDDTVVPIEQSELMEAALKRAHKPVEFVRMEGEDHWLSRSETRTQMLKASVEFVRRHNPPD